MVFKIKDKNLFWVDQVTSEVTKKVDEDDLAPVVKCGASPSGGKHIGNLNDIIRADFIVKSLEEKKYNPKFIHTCDDRDPLRKIPSKLPDLDGNWHESNKEFNRYIGMPYVDIPDPFDCCSSWGQHFNNVWLKGAKLLGINVENHSNDRLYQSGAFYPYIRYVFEHLKETRDVLKKFQKNITKDYIPFQAICENCGKITTKVVDFDIESETVRYECRDKTLAKSFNIKGCGHKGEVSFKEGKVPWRLEWPFQWAYFGVVCEPFGKDHLQGSWPSGQAIAKKLLGIKPPIPLVYEFFLVNNEKMSTRHGNAYIAQDILKVLPSEIIRYFYTKKPSKQRNFDLENIYRLTNEYDNIEEIYYGRKSAKNEKEEINFKKMYKLSNLYIAKEFAKQIPYNIAALIGQVANENQWKSKVESMIGEVENFEKIRARIIEAKNWVENYAKDEYKIELVDKVPKGVKNSINKDVLEKVLDLVEDIPKDVETLNKSLFNISKELDIPKKEVFKSCYLALLGKNSGPRLASFIMSLDKDQVRNRFQQVLNA